MKKVMVIYHSQEHGNTAALAELVAQGVRQAGAIQVEVLNLNEVNRVSIDRLAACDGLALGSPDYYSYVAGTVKQLFDDILVAQRRGVSIKGKPCVLFLTHGGGGRAVTPFKALARNLNLLAEPYACQGAPCPGNPEALALGRRLGEAVL